jgi:hypothetical protein
MNEELTRKLVEDFPVLYREHKLPVTHSCMGWGFQCGDGWEGPIRRLSERLEGWNREHPHTPVVATTVKEKYGGLRFYTNGVAASEVEGWIVEAEEECHATCEWCGGREDMGTTQGYISRVCRGCAVREDRIAAWVADGPRARGGESESTRIY